MPDDLARAFAFMVGGEMAGTRTEVSSFGVAVRSDEVPLRQDSNYLLVERTEASGKALAAEVDRLGLRTLLVLDEPTGVRLETDFERLDWKKHRGVVMAHRRAADRRADTGLVVEVDEARLRPLRRRAILAAPWGSPELAEQLLDAKLLTASRVDTRFLAVLVDDEVVACADLYEKGSIAQIEDLQTVEEHRGRGYASALVLHALAAAVERGAGLVFLVTNTDDGPVSLYSSLGFEPIGHYFKFFR